MPNPIDASHAWVHEFQSRFGATPGSQEAKAELEQCVQMCNELLAEREKLRAEVVRLNVERDFYYHAANVLMQEAGKNYTMEKEEMLALVGKQAPLAELIAELEGEDD
jgi:hypothetical protein